MSEAVTCTRESDVTEANVKLPFVSVIMPVRNEADFIERSLRAVLAQEYPRDQMEVFIVDGLSTDATPQIVQQIAAQDPRVKLLTNPARIAPCAMNIGTSQARGDVIVRVDGHCIIALDYVARCVDHLQSRGVQGVGGSIDTIGQDRLSQAIAVVMSSKFGVGGSAFRTLQDTTRLVDTIPFPAYTREALGLAGHYDEELVRNQDDEFNYRLRKLGGKLLLASDVKSKYYSRGTLRSLGRQYRQYGFWKVRVMQKHPLQMSIRQFVPAAFVLALVASGIGACFSVWSAGLFLSLLLSYAIANLAASALEARRSGWAIATRLPIAFALVHFGYGIGFLSGLVWFWNRWGTPTRFPHGRPSIEPAPARS